MAAGGARVYDLGEIPLLDVGPPLRFRSPSLEGESGAAPDLEVEVLRSAIPDTLLARRDQSLELPVLGISRGNGGVRADDMVEDHLTASWSINVLADTSSGPVLSLRGLELPPAVLQLPLGMLPRRATEGRLELDALILHRLSSADGAYRIFVQRRYACAVPVRITN